MRRFNLFMALVCFVALLAGSAGAGDFTPRTDPEPPYVTELERIFGGPSSSAFGSAVFWSSADDRRQLEAMALAAYRHFVGEAWDRRGEAAWKAEWRLVHERRSERNIVAELLTITDPAARSSAGMLVEGTQETVAARAALSLAFDDPTITDVLVYNLGDAEAMSGLLVAGRRQNRDATFLLFLMD